MEKTEKAGFKGEKLMDFLNRKMKEATEEFDLPSGLKCKMTYFSAKKAKIAQEIATSGSGESAKVNEEMLYGAMVSESCRFRVDDSGPWEAMRADQVTDMMSGMDFMTLQGKLSGVSLEEEK